MVRCMRQLVIDNDSDSESNSDGGLYSYRGSRSNSGSGSGSGSSGSDAGLYNWEECDPALVEDGAVRADRAGPAQVERNNRISVDHSNSNSGGGMNEGRHGEYLNWLGLLHRHLCDI